MLLGQYFGGVIVQHIQKVPEGLQAPGLSLRRFTKIGMFLCPFVHASVLGKRKEEMRFSITGFLVSLALPLSGLYVT